MQPKTYLVGVTSPMIEEIRRFLDDTGQDEFMQQFVEANQEHGPTALVSMFAKLCYRSLVTGKNANVSRVRDVEENVIGCIKQGHGSVFEHVWLNFVTVQCSRVFTHELVRHRVGTAFSQTSGRYCTVEDAGLVLPPHFDDVQFGDTSLRERFDLALEELKQVVSEARDVLDLDNRPMQEKKWWTSALRRIMPNGANNEIGWSCNIRSLRHMIEMRTSRHAEWEIRIVFAEVAALVKERWPLMLYGAKEEEVDGIAEYTGLKV